MNSASASPAGTGTRRTGPPVWALVGGTELRRLVMHPLFAVSLAFVTLASLVDSPGGPRDAYYVVTGSWGRTAQEWAGLIDGSRGWHAVYLAGLCAMAAIGALLVHVRRKRRLFALGLAVTALTGVAGWAQLP